MSKQEDILEQLSAYLDGELTPAEVRDVEAMLQSDPSLEEELERMRRVTAMVRGLPRERAGADFSARVLAQAERITLVGKHHHAEGGGLTWIRYGAVAALLLICLGVAGFVIKAFNTPDFRDRVASKGPEPTGVTDVVRESRKLGPERADGLKDADKSSLEYRAAPAKKDKASLAETPASDIAAAPREENGKKIGKEISREAVEVAIAPPPSTVHGKAAKAMSKGWGGGNEKPVGVAGSGGLNKGEQVDTQMAEEVEVAGEEVIWTDNVQTAAGDVEKVLQRNGIAMAANNTFNSSSQTVVNNGGVVNVSDVSAPLGQAVRQKEAHEIVQPKVAAAQAPPAQATPTGQWAAAASAPQHLAKAGGGTLTLNAANTYSGATTITAGDLNASQQQGLNVRNRVSRPALQGGNGYVLNAASPTQVQYYVYVPTSQVPKLQSDFNMLRNSTRYNQIMANGQISNQNYVGNGQQWSESRQAKNAAVGISGKDAEPFAQTNLSPSNQAESIPANRNIAVQPVSASTDFKGTQTVSGVVSSTLQQSQGQARQLRTQRESLQALVITVNGLPESISPSPAKANAADAAQSDLPHPASK